jgi:hypothetical protein
VAIESVGKEDERSGQKIKGKYLKYKFLYINDFTIWCNTGHKRDKFLMSCTDKQDQYSLASSTCRY